MKINAKEKNITSSSYRKELYYSPGERNLILADLAVLPLGSQITAMAEIKKQPAICGYLQISGTGMER